MSLDNPLRKNLSTDFLKSVPKVPGVYFMLSKEGSILYIGKAKKLRNRLSDYFQTKPGRTPEHILEMIESVRKIRWQECSSEKAALELESDLLHAIRPPFNIAGTETCHSLFIGIRRQSGPCNEKPGRIKLDFQLSSFERIVSDRYVLHGCYKHRGKTKSGYTALLRLIYAATTESRRFSYPARISRFSPRWLYTTIFPSNWLAALNRFLEGRGTQLLQLIIWRLLENENVPSFMRYSLQDDIEMVKEFYRVGPKATCELKKKHGIRSRILTQDQMDELLAESALALSAYPCHRHDDEVPDRDRKLLNGR